MGLTVLEEDLEKLAYLFSRDDCQEFRDAIVTDAHCRNDARSEVILRSHAAPVFRMLVLITISPSDTACRHSIAAAGADHVCAVSSR